MKKVLVAIFWTVFFVARASAQDDTAPPTTAYTWSAADLQKLVGPIALYPDPLIAEILPASTFPSEIVMADRYLGGGGDPRQIDQQPWDPSVQALAHYPTVLKWMDDNVQWTTQLGQAFQNQQPDVMAAIQTLRGQAQSLGNLPSNPQENVVTDDGQIEIEPANPDDMYVPSYDANTIFYDPGIYCTFGIGLPLGGWLAYGWDWHGGHLFYSHGGLPGGWWHQSPGWRHNYIVGHPVPVWHGGGVVVHGGGWNRGFPDGHGLAPVIPRGAAPRVEQHGEIVHGGGGFHASGGGFRNEAAPREEGNFGGSGAEAHAWSSRGEASRSEPVGSGGGHAGGGESHGGGGGEIHASGGESHGGGGGGGESHGGGGGGGGRH